MLDTLSRYALRLLVGGFQNVRRAVWFVTDPEVIGAHAIPVTPEGRIVLVKLRYRTGWHIPGGGSHKGESPQDTALREAREEIGMTAYGAVEFVTETRMRWDFRRDTASVFLLRDVVYRPVWSFEVEAMMEAKADALPADTSPRVRDWIMAARPLL